MCDAARACRSLATTLTFVGLTLQLAMLRVLQGRFGANRTYWVTRPAAKVTACQLQNTLQKAFADKIRVGHVPRRVLWSSSLETS